MTRRYRAQLGNYLSGLCCYDGKLYTVEENTEDYKIKLAMYDISGAGGANLILLDSVQLRGRGWQYPRVDQHGLGLVYVPCREAGTRIFRCEGSRLVSARDPLTCVERARSLAVYTEDTVYICDRTSNTVCLVSVSTDTVVSRLEKPEQVGGYTPDHVSVLGETILVCYGKNTLVAFHSDSPTLGQVLQTPEGLVDVSSISTDGHSRFLVTCHTPKSVYVLDISGDVQDIIQPNLSDLPDDVTLQDCAVAQSQLWVQYYWGHIVVMSPQS